MTTMFLNTSVGKLYSEFASNPGRIFDPKLAKITVQEVNRTFTQFRSEGFLQEARSSNSSDTIFELKDEFGKIAKYVTTQGNAFQGNQSTLKVCMFHGLPFSGLGIGVPSKKEVDIFEEDGLMKTITTFHVSGMFCSFNCALGYSRERGDHKHASLTKEWFEMCYPGKTLSAPKDPLFLEHFGGHMKFEDWIRESQTFTDTGNTVYHFTKKTYLFKKSPTTFTTFRK